MSQDREHGFFRTIAHIKHLSICSQSPAFSAVIELLEQIKTLRIVNQSLVILPGQLV